MVDNGDYRSLFRDAGDGILRTDMQGRILEANAAFQAMVGRTEGELRRLTHAGLTPGSWLEEEGRILAEQVLKRGFSDPYRKEYRRADGALLPVEMRVQLLRDGAGRPAGFWAVARDVTERARTENAMRASSAFLDSIIDQSPTPTWISDVGGNLIRVNKANLDLLHMREEEILGLYNIFRDNIVEKQGFMPLIRRVYEEGVSVRFRLVWDSADLRDLRFLDHAPVVLLTSVFPILDAAGKVTHAVFQHLDVTRLTQAESEKARLEAQLLQAQKMESIGRLAGGIAHDFNNMLEVIQGYSDLLADRLGPQDPLWHYVDGIRKAAGRSAEVTGQLLAFSRRQVIEPRVVDLNAVIEDLRSTLEPLIGEDVTLRITADPGQCLILADPAQLAQVLVNMAANARDAMPEGGELGITTSHALLDGSSRGRGDCRPGPHVLLEVSDGGIGMDGETMAHLFEPFYTTKDVGRGTGLGLATVYGIVKQNGGCIGVESRPGCGSVFRIYLPAAEGAARREEPAPAGRPPEAGRHETILLVEDDGLVRATAQAMLEALGYRVLPAGSGREAVVSCAESDRAVDLLLTDIVMPDMNGAELRDRVVRIRPGLPVLFMSGYTADVIASHGILEDGVDLVQKPFDLPLLDRRIREVLERAQRPPTP